MLCRERVAQLREHMPALEEAGVGVAVVGPGTPAMVGAFLEEVGGQIPLYSDPERASFRAAGARRGLLSVLSPRSFLNYFRAIRTGFRQSKISGDPLQQGGVLVVSREQDLLYQHMDRAGGDPIPWPSVLRACV